MIAARERTERRDRKAHLCVLCVPSPQENFASNQNPSSCRSASATSLWVGKPKARLMRATVSIVGTRRLVSMKAELPREPRQRRQPVERQPARSAPLADDAANASHTGSSVVRGSGLGSIIAPDERLSLLQKP